MKRKIIDVTTGKVSIVELSPEEIAAVMARQPDPAIEATKQQFAAAATAIFESMSLGKQALWEQVKQAVTKAIFAGDLATAKEILTTVPALYPGAEDDRTAFLNLFPKS